VNRDMASRDHALSIGGARRIMDTLILASRNPLGVAGVMMADEIKAKAARAAYSTRPLSVSGRPSGSAPLATDTRKLLKTLIPPRSGDA
jgi:hypothetical protein